jgi:hypothetical protein
MEDSGQWNGKMPAQGRKVWGFLVRGFLVRRLEGFWLEGYWLEGLCTKYQTRPAARSSNKRAATTAPNCKNRMVRRRRTRFRSSRISNFCQACSDGRSCSLDSFFLKNSNKSMFHKSMNDVTPTRNPQTFQPETFQPETLQPETLKRFPLLSATVSFCLLPESIATCWY